MSASIDPVAATLAIAALFAVGAGLALWRLRIVFVVDITDDGALLRRGRAAAGFVDGCSDVARRHGITRGRITGVRDGASVRLQFSRDIPARSHQAFRNVWTPPPPSGGPSGGGMRASG
ncbi:DUF3634 family protein [Aquisalimonas asiatica]|uniref:DUF3634 family protein n=1 Tax=Aquisalimonas asiatica TaxID=406100 RepID=UPI000B842844|nr:DUF3634 family protein [Aquisalimonas asiatica]